MKRTQIRIGAPDAPVLDAFMACRERVSVIIGPLGSGKTFGALQRLLKQMAEQEPNAKGVRPSRWVAVRNTYPDLATTTIRDFREVFEPFGKYKGGGLEPPSFNIDINLADGTQIQSEVIFLALDREDAIRKIRGLQITGAWLHETKELIKPVVDMLDLRHGRYPTEAAGGVPCTWHGMFGDTNAPDEDHWLYELAEEVKPPGWAFFKQPGGLVASGKLPDGSTVWEANEHAENLPNLPSGYYVNGMAGKQQDWVHVNLANEYGFTVDGKPVHPEYIDSRHCAAEPISTDFTRPLLLGIDFGRTPAAAICQHDEAAGRYVCIDEFVTSDMSSALFAPELKRYLDTNYGSLAVRAFGDPAGDKAGQTVETTPIEYLRKHGIPCQPAPSNQPLLRRAALARPFSEVCMHDGRPRLLISPKAKMVRKGLMGGFRYRRMKVEGTERYTDEPDKNQYSHPVEALEYALLGAGEGRGAIPAARARTGRRQQWAIG